MFTKKRVYVFGILVGHYRIALLLSIGQLVKLFL